MNYKIKGGYKQETRSGKNLINWEAPSLTANVTYSFENDTVIVSSSEGTYRKAYWDVTNLIKTNIGKTIYFNYESVDFSSGNKPTVQLTIKMSDDTVNYVGFLTATFKKQTYTIPSDAATTITSAMLNVVCNNTSTSGEYSITIVKPIISFNENDTYEQYGVSPSPSYPSKIDTVVGNNINEFDGELELGSIGNNDGKNYGTTKNTRSKNYLAVEENTTYALSDNINGSFIVHAYDKDKNWLKMIGASNYTGKYIFTTPTQTVYIRFRTNETDLTAKIKLEKGSTVTPYSPPGVGSIEISITNSDSSKTQTITMPLQQEMLEGDYIEDVEHHEWKRTELTGNEKWSMSNEQNFMRFITTLPNAISFSDTGRHSDAVLSNKFRPSQESDYGVVFMYKDITFFLAQETIKSLDEWKQYLKQQYEVGTPVIVYYKLATPIDSELTEEQKTVREQKLYTYKNVTNISVSDELASVDIEYKKDQDTINKNYENRLAALETASTSEEANKCGNLY